LFERLKLIDTDAGGSHNVLLKATQN
jgi:hypothetical protein